MNDNATRVINAASAGLQVMDEHSSVWNGKPVIATKKAALEDKIEQIELLDEGITDGTGLPAKITARENAALAALRLAKPMTVFARDTNNDVLEEEINLSWSKLRYGKDQDVIDYWQLVHDRAEEYDAALAADGYTESGWTTQLADAINVFKTNRSKPKAKRSDEKAINAQIAIGIKELQAIKTDLLDLLVQFMPSEPLFYNAVDAAFELDMTGKRHVALRLRFIDEATSIRLPLVKAHIVELDITKTASKNGIIDFSQQQLPQANYSITFTLKGYAEQTIKNIAVVHGKLNTMEIILVKEGANPSTTGSVAGQVRLMGNPVNGATVFAASDANAGPSTTTDSNGNYILNGLSNGSTNITASYAEYMPITQNINVVAAETATLNFDF